MTSFTVLMIATNNYISYAKTSIDSIKSSLFTNNPGQVLIFTDQPKEFINYSDERINVEAIQIPSFGWPDATLLRYEIFANNWERVSGDFVIYLDADTKVTGKPQFSNVNFEGLRNGVGLVRHPGYFKTGILKGIKAKSPLGTWETRKSSQAFVPIWKRGSYVCGGVWMGNYKAIEALVKLLSARVQVDNNQGLIAKWHDESHLNWWKSNFSPTLLTPEWAFANGYPNLVGITPLITVIEKPNSKEFH